MTEALEAEGIPVEVGSPGPLPAECDLVIRSAAIRDDHPQILEAEARWVVDPIDGTVNFAHRIPHAAESIALQDRETPRSAGYSDGYATVAG
ncbi:MAG: inositol monophosphatase family protein, partial [Alphaproteobacteria bacterium]